MIRKPQRGSRITSSLCSGFGDMYGYALRGTSCESGPQGEKDVETCTMSMLRIRKFVYLKKTKAKKGAQENMVENVRKDKRVWKGGEHNGKKY